MIGALAREQFLDRFFVWPEQRRGRRVFALEASRIARKAVEELRRPINPTRGLVLLSQKIGDITSIKMTNSDPIRSPNVSPRRTREGNVRINPR
jgi:hypothetical protein